MSNFTFNTPSGETFEIKAPSGTTFDQAQAIFKQQLASGGLTGFKIGDVLSSATQSANGLTSAQAQLTQTLAGLSGKLPVGTNLNSITSEFGTTGAPAAGQLSSALIGPTRAISSTVTGASAGALSTTANQPLAWVFPSLSAVTGALTGQSAQPGSLANQAITGISKAIGGVPNNGIDASDFAKQGPALASIGNLNQNDVTGTLAQAAKLIGQDPRQISNTLGAGKFGFDITQLEKAGLIKPGTNASFLSNNTSNLTSVLSSPTVWTGKDGVKSLDGLLNNPALQDKVQQGLMTNGLIDLRSLGLPTEKLTPQALSGVATNAARSVTDTLKWAQGTGAVPGLPNAPAIPALPPEIKANFDAAATNGAFAVNLTQNKISPELKQEVIVAPAENTVNAVTLVAAAKRIVGNDKVPSVLGT